MHIATLRGGLAGLALAVLVATGSAAWAETVAFRAALSGASEVPPTTTKGVGSLTASFDTATKSLSWTVEYSGLSGPATMAHFHGPAAAGANAGVVVPMTGDLASPMKGSATLTDAQIADLTAGKWYFNIHSAENKPGEIRGQVLKGN